MHWLWLHTAPLHVRWIINVYTYIIYPHDGPRTKRKREHKATRETKQQKKKPFNEQITLSIFYKSFDTQ